MKKITLLIMSLFVVGVSLAQVSADFEFEPQTTSLNMSVLFPSGSLDAYNGGLATAFIDGQPVSSAVEIGSIVAGSVGLSIFGQDIQCGCTYGSVGDEVTFAILMNGEVIIITSINPPLLLSNGGNETLSSDMISFSIDGNSVVFGCTDAAYTEYNATANITDGSCSTLVVEGCTDASACNFADAANTEDESCTYVDGICDSCENGIVVDNDADDDGVCDFDEIVGCRVSSACNYDADPTTDAENTLCVYADAVCETCENDAVAFYDVDSDGYCDLGSGLSPSEVLGCTGVMAFNYNPSATEEDESCVDVVAGCMNPAADNNCIECNTPDPDACEYSGINPWGPNGGLDTLPTYITANSMSVLVQAGLTSTLNNFNDMVDGDILFAVYETARLDVNSVVGFSYSEVSGIASAGAAVWTGDQAGIPVFGSGNSLDNGFNEGEEITWLVQRGDIVYNVQVLDADDNSISISWEAGEFATIGGIIVGTPYYDGCMDATAPNFKPLATEDDGSCEAPYSIGCMDEAAVNFAGADANPVHENATNYGNAFGENHSINLISQALSLSGVAANIHDQEYCQAQVEGCTDAMAMNYNPLNTQNDKTICDWTINGMIEYNVDVDGNVLETEYSFGAVDSDNVNDGIVGSDFDNAQLLFEEGYLTPTAHVIDNLADVMQWIDMDEERDAIELSDTINDMQARYDANDLLWLTTYDDTLAAVATWFAADEAADLQELTDSLTDNYRRFFVNDSTWNKTYVDTLDAVAVWFAADETADAAELDSTEVSDDALLAQTILDMQAVYDANETMWLAYTAATLVSSDSLLAVTNDTLDYHRAPIVIDLHSQWNTIAYYLQHESPVVAQFEKQFPSASGENSVAANINIIKNNEGLFYWPEFSYDGIGMLQSGQGYQVRVKDTSDGKFDFIFDHSINADAYRTIVPTVPAWAIDMEVQNHPNDIRTLVRVVNMLGQEVNPADQFNGEVLLYMYNDGTVEKKMVE